MAKLVMVTSFSIFKFLQPRTLAKPVPMTARVSSLHSARGAPIVICMQIMALSLRLTLLLPGRTGLVEAI
jgi:hypothetical protein